MLVLGVTADDKGAQLEALVRSVLESQGYQRVRKNIVASGGNELDVVAERESEVVGAIQVTPLICEAKAYADPVAMPAWQRFLGKLLLARAEESNTVGILVALNAVNGNVAGSYASLRKHDSAVFVIEGKDLLARAIESGEVGKEDAVRETITNEFHQESSRLEPAYYGGGFSWVVWWQEDEYSVVDGRGSMLSAERVESLRSALEGTVSGRLLAAEEAQARTEAQHAARISVINRLLTSTDLPPTEPIDEGEDALASLAKEPYCRLEDGRLVLVPANELNAAGVSRLFLSLFEGPVPVEHLSFMVDHHHDDYVNRLIDVLPDNQSGFFLDEESIKTLRAIAPLFPSVWVTIASPIQIITTHRASQPEVENDAVLASDRTAFWEEVIKAVRSDFTNMFLRGFLYDHLGVAEMEEKVEVIVKSKQGPVGEMRTEGRNAVRQLSDELVGEAGTRHVLIRMLPTTKQPWDETHPGPAMPLESQS